MNLYTDITSDIRSQHIEKSLSRLEGQAADVIAKIQSARGQGTFSLSRRELEVLRKFVYVMHFRQPAIIEQYFSPGEEDILTDWRQHYMKAHDLETPGDMWLHTLSYVLDTPHPIIVAKGEEMAAHYGSERLLQMFRTRVDPEFENWPAADYRSLAHTYYIGVWEAAPGCEFLLGSSGFGAWEGLLNTPGLGTNGRPNIHRIFVISPKLALILRINVLRSLGEGAQHAILESALSTIDMPTPTTKFHGPVGTFLVEEELQRYRATPEAQNDIFTYRITKLTEAQTREVNETVLINTGYEIDGDSLIFSSKKCMLNALQYHITSPDFRVQYGKNPHKKYFPLYHSLLCSLNSPSKNIIESDSDFRLRVVLEVLRRRLIRFRSEWNQGFWCYRAMTADPAQLHPLAVDVRLRLPWAISTFESFPQDKNLRKNLSARLVDSLSEEDSNCVMGRVCTVLRGLTVIGLERTRARTDESYVRSSLIVGFVEWMVKERPDTIKVLVGARTYGRLTLV